MKPPNARDTIAIACRLLEAGRAEEALGWIRRPGSGGLRYMTEADLTDGRMPGEVAASQRVRLEARILEALGDRIAAQTLRWSAFEQSLDATILRDYLDALPEFEDVEALDRAFAHVLASETIDTALVFLSEWPKPDLAARLVIARQADWNGSQYHILPPVADALADGYPLAATILYRALLDDILTRARAKAYPHAARYLATLDRLAACADAGPFGDLLPHTRYREALRKNHARKTGFWALVKMP